MRRIDQRLKHDAEPVAARLELREHVGAVAAAEIDDAVTIAPAVLQFGGQLAPDRARAARP